MRRHRGWRRHSTVGERLRSRVLLDYLAQAGVPQAPDADRAAARRGARATHRQHPAAPALERTRRAGAAFPARAAPAARSRASRARRRPDRGSRTEGLQFASIETIQQALDDREALLWFSIAPWKDLYDDFGGGAWLVAVTRRAATVHRVAAPVDLDTQVAAFTGLLRARDAAPGMWTDAARQLGKTLLGGAVAGLPPEIERLVIVSDGVLHRVPFEALRSTRDASRSASASRSVSCRRRRCGCVCGNRERRQLAAGPRPCRSRAVTRESATAICVSGRCRGRDGKRRRSASCSTSTPATCSKAARRRSARSRHLSFAPFGVLHLAAHARADAAFPERSAVFLTPGDASEDGWLQPREIARSISAAGWSCCRHASRRTGRCCPARGR